LIRIRYEPEDVEAYITYKICDYNGITSSNTEQYILDTIKAILALFSTHYTGSSSSNSSAADSPMNSSLSQLAFGSDVSSQLLPFSLQDLFSSANEDNLIENHCNMFESNNSISTLDIIIKAASSFLVLSLYAAIFVTSLSVSTQQNVTTDKEGSMKVTPSKIPLSPSQVSPTSIAIFCTVFKAFR
jgi:hypothetical protein